MTDTCADNAKRGISVKSTGISLSYQMTDANLEPLREKRDGNNYVINLIDSPGHVDFSSEVAAALRITDGALLVVDCIEGVCMQTETVIYQSIYERVRPVLTINKVDRCFVGPQADGEEVYQLFRSLIEDVNDAVHVDDLKVDPQNGTVAFSSGLDGWAFTLASFAKMCASKHRVKESRVMKRLWGENYYDPKTKQWTKKHTGSATCQRGFVSLCYEPIKRIVGHCMNDQKDQLWPLLDQLGVAMTHDERALTGNLLMKRVMQKWLPCANTLIDMTICHLPSPGTAQVYRAEILYKGPPNDVYARAIRNCDPEGPLVLYVSKMIPASNNPGRFYAFGRVFAGRVSAGLEVTIMSADHVHGEKKDFPIRIVQNPAIWMGTLQQTVNHVPCGNTVVLYGLDEFFTKNATITQEKETGAHPIHPMRLPVFPVLRVEVKCKNPLDNLKLTQSLNFLSKSDPVVVCTTEASGGGVITGVGELHLEFCLKDLKERYLRGVEIVVSKPFVPFSETVSEMNTGGDYSLFMKARPMDIPLVCAIEDGLCDNPEVYEKILLEEFGWDKGLATLWCFGPDWTGPNMLVDTCNGVEYLNEIKDSIMESFASVSKEGVLALENMRGICFEVCDAALLYETIYSGIIDQVIPASRKVFHAVQKSAKPRLVEPIYMVEIQAPEHALDTIITFLKNKRECSYKQMPTQGNRLCKIMAHMPVVESLDTCAPDL
ncbi:hypothetical protein L2E82_51702 [Cichorium intybus]|nr:hypothetical protein L2E82_51702 [Cichorium intybus]